MEAVMFVEELDRGHPVLAERFAGAGAECRIGRDLDSDFVVDDEHAAPQHALLTLLEDGRVNVRDLGTRNGTLRQAAGTGRGGAEHRAGRARRGPHAAARPHAAHADRPGTRTSGATSCAGTPDAARGRRRARRLRWLRGLRPVARWPASLLPSVTTAVLVGLGAIAGC